MNNSWKTHSTKTVHDSPWIKIDVSDVTTPGGSPGQYHVVHFKHIAIGIIPMDDDGYIYLVGQWRYPLNQYSWEIPEGGGKLDVEPLESAKRELKEETGLTAASWVKVLDMHLSNSATDEYGVLYLATGLTEGESEPEEDEDLQLKKMHHSEFYHAVMRGEITDSLTVAAALHLRILALEGKI
jgi:8-oxo-dGTP pyrophosphatase MutT (NUDIX family)